MMRSAFFPIIRGIVPQNMLYIVNLFKKMLHATKTCSLHSRIDRTKGINLSKLEITKNMIPIKAN
mgnify:CR=1 FL=1